MFLVYSAVMQEPITNLINSLMPSLPASGGEKPSALQGKEKGAFSDVLQMLSGGESGQETSAAKAEGNGDDGVASNLADLLQALLVSDMGDLSQSLQVGASADGAGTEKSSASSAPSSDISGNSGSTGKTGLSVESLLSALSTLFGTKGKVTGGTRGASNDPPPGAGTGTEVSSGAASTTTDAPTSGITTAKETAGGISSGNSTDQAGSNQDTKDALQTLAILVFNSLLAVLQNQPRTPANQGSAGAATDGLSPAGGQVSGSGGPGQEMIYQALINLGRFSDAALSASQPTQGTAQSQQAPDEADANKTQAGASQESAGVSTDLLRSLNRDLQVMNRIRTTLREEGDRSSSKETADMTNAPPEVSSEGKGSLSAQVTLAVNSPAAEGVDDTNTLTVAIKTPSGSIAQNGVMPLTNGAMDPSAASEKQSASEKADLTITSIVKDLSPLVKRDGEGSLHNNGDEKEQPSGQDSYPFAAKADAGASSAGQDQTGKTSGPSVSTNPADRFEKVIEQFGSGNAQHDLTVKLDMGKEGSVILGLKDMGPNVTVEVRASDQGIITLLQSQKDSIIKNLEGKDVHANIFIDPNASGTPDKQDRRETARQRTFQPSPRVDTGFGEVLDVFA